MFEPTPRAPRYIKIASAIEAALDRGELRAGDQLPTVRALAVQLGVSSASVAVAYSLLERRGRLLAHVGRGTFVRESADGRGQHSSSRQSSLVGSPLAYNRGSDVPIARAWRRRVLQFGDRLRAISPEALVCSSSWPDAGLLPFEVMRRAYARAVAQLQPSDLQYGGPEAHPELARALVPRLQADGVALESGPGSLLVMSSFGQLLTILLQLAPALVDTPTISVAVEEPGYHAAFNLIETLGHRLVGVGIDEHGAEPESLRQALEDGASLVLLTPRALNPTGASWTIRRRQALADVLRQHPHAIIVEDDHCAGLATGRPGSLWTDPDLQERTVHARSFSKSVAPDLRMTVVVARGRLHALLRDGKLRDGGWAPRLGQRALAAALEDPDLDVALTEASLAYSQRRQAAIRALREHLPATAVAVAQDGLNVWVSLPAGCDAQDVIQHAAH
ncbi:MAG TPA: PLP-dependent aminotransferase family protein, partial [Chloroflexota bacterium]